MKKTFKTFALMLLTAFALSSCVDVPAPFNLPDKSSSSDGGGSSSNEGTPITCAQAVELTNALADGATSSEVYTITGYITEVVGNVSKNQQTFWMADAKDGGRIFEAFWANLPEGVSVFTKGTKVKITGKLMKYVNTNNGNVIAEMKNATVTILTDDGGDTPAEDVIPVSCVIAAQTANSLPDNATSEETYCVTGYITKVIGAVSTKTGTPQQSFWMADKMEDGEIFQAYYANLPEGVSEFVIGMKVKITGKLLNYKNANGGGAAEMKNATVVILPDDGGGDGGETPPAGDVIDVTCTEAVELTNALDNGATSTETYTVTGYITEVIGAVSRNQQTFWMADTKDGGRVFEAFYANLPEGVSAFTAGAKVKITGQLLKYVNSTSGQVTPEIKNANVVILEQGDGGQGGGGDTPGPTPGPGGDEVTELVNGGFEEWVTGSTTPVGWKSASSASNATLSQSQDAHGGSYACLVAAPGSTNKRLASQEITLEAGSYTFSFYAKSTTADKSQTKCGFVPVNANDGSVGTYKYGDFFDLNNNGWTLVSCEFNLDEKTTVCLVVMNPKDSNYSKSQDILVDDATLVKK